MEKKQQLKIDNNFKNTKRQQRKSIISKIEKLNTGDRYWKYSYGRSLEDTKKVYDTIASRHNYRVVIPLRNEQRIKLAEKLGDRKLRNLSFETLRQRYIETMERKAQINNFRKQLVQKAERVRINQYGRYKEQYLNKKIDNKNVLANLIKNSRPGDRLVLRAERNGKFIYRNISNADQATRRIYLQILADSYKQDEMGIADSAGDLNALYILENNPTLVKIMNNRGRNKAGLYFPFYNKTNIDLSKYQIYKEENDLTNSEHCLIYTLRQAGIENNVLSRIATTFIYSNHYLKKELHKVSNIINRKICLNEYDPSNTLRKYYYGDDFVADGSDNKEKECINIALYKNHYFIFENTIYTHFVTRNYDRCKEYKRFHNITSIEKRDEKVYTIRDKKFQTVSSLTLVKRLLDHGHMKRIEYKKHEILEHVIDLKGIATEQRPFVFKEKFIRRNKIFFADTETVLNDDKKHILYMAAIIDDTEDNVFLSKSYLAHSDLFNYIVSRTNKSDYIICYFHNLKYDSAILSPLFKYTGSTEKSGNVYGIDILYRGRTIHLRDSYKLIPCALRDFKKTFQLTIGKKEAIAYSFYKIHTSDTADIKEYISHLHEHEVPIFLEALRDDPILFDYDEKNNTFNCIKYYKYYLSLDVLVLREGLRSFARDISTLTENKMNAYDFMTCSSIAHHYASMHGAYDEVYEVTGNLRAYLSKAVCGGRVYSNENYTKVEVCEPTAYLDIVSLYPSAMERLSRQYGFITGPCVYFEGHNIPPCSYAIMTIEIIKINKHQQMPFVSISGGDNIVYTNTANNQIVYIDTITLEDYIKFHHIEYKILHGVYWTGHFNKNIGNIINTLTNERNKYKALKNESMSTIVKLLMNSIYGKTITKMSNTAIRYVEDFNYIVKNFDNITSWYDKGYNQMRVKMNKADDSYNMCHIGTSILSMSKRIMNEIMDVCNEQKINCYYQDTDSIHLEASKINLLNEEFNRIYNYYILGTTLGKLQHDFKLENCRDITAVKCIFLGRKSYIDVIQGTDIKTGELKTGIHNRLKGIPTKSIQYKADQDFKGDIYELYKQLATGQEMEFVLNPTSLLPSFDFKFGSVYTRPDGSFKRIISF